MFVTQTLLAAYQLPEDGLQAKADVLGLIGSAKKSVRVKMFGFDDRDLAQALINAQHRTQDVKCILDLSQSKGPTEATLLHWFFLSFPPENVTITTSPLHAIMHEKSVEIDGDADVPDQQFETVQAAQEAGYPILISGSVNWSGGGFAKQVNVCYIFPGKLICQQARQSFDALWTWGRTHEAAYKVAQEVVAGARVELAEKGL